MDWVLYDSDLRHEIVKVEVKSGRTWRSLRIQIISGVYVIKKCWFRGVLSHVRTQESHAHTKTSGVYVIKKR